MSTISLSNVRREVTGYELKYAPQDVLDLTPKLGNKIGFNVKGAFRCDGSNREQLLQLGRALAHRDSAYWSIDETWNDGPGVYHLEHRFSHRCIRPSAENTDKGVVAHVEEYNVLKDRWLPHPITRKCFISTMIEKKGSREFVTAWTKYHFLAKILANKPISIQTDDVRWSWEVVIDGYQREMWRLAGYDYRDFPALLEAEQAS